MVEIKTNDHSVSLNISSSFWSMKEKHRDIAAAGILFFVLAFAGAFLNLPCFLLLINKESIFLTISWRFLVLFLFILPKFLYDVLQDLNLSGRIICLNLFPIMGLAVLNTLYIYMIYFAVLKTYVAHTLLLCSIGSAYLATWKIARGLPHSRFDYYGIGITVFGAYWCCCEGDNLNSNIVFGMYLGDNILIGDFVAIASSAIFTIYTSLSTMVVDARTCPDSFYCTLMSGCVIVYSSILSVIFGEKITLSMDPLTGIFGFFNGW